MSPASYLTAPPRVAGAVYRGRRFVSSIRPVTTAIWSAFGFLCFAVAAGIAWVLFQLVQAWRQLRRLPGGLLGQVAEVTRALAEVQERVTTVERQVGELQQHVESLSASLARAQVLLGAVKEVRSAVASVRSFVPGK
jgi:hypothetical protein